MVVFDNNEYFSLHDILFFISGLNLLITQNHLVLSPTSLFDPDLPNFISSIQK